MTTNGWGNLSDSWMLLISMSAVLTTRWHLSDPLCMRFKLSLLLLGWCSKGEFAGMKIEGRVTRISALSWTREGVYYYIMRWNHTGYIVPLLAPVKVGVYDVVKNHQQNGPLLRTESSVTGHKIIIFAPFHLPKSSRRNKPSLFFSGNEVELGSGCWQGWEELWGGITDTRMSVFSLWNVAFLFSVSFIHCRYIPDTVYFSVFGVNKLQMLVDGYLVGREFISWKYICIFPLKTSLLSIQTILLLILGSDLSISWMFFLLA